MAVAVSVSVSVRHRGAGAGAPHEQALPAAGRRLAAAGARRPRCLLPGQEHEPLRGAGRLRRGACGRRWQQQQRRRRGLLLSAAEPAVAAAA